MRYLLDTNAVIAFVNRRSGPLYERLAAAPRGVLVLSALVVHELAYGAYHSGKVELNLSTLDMLMGDLSVIDFTAEDARAAGLVRAQLASRGTPIGPYDVLIAGQAKARDLCLVTNNTREFARVAGLRIEDWMG